MLQIYPLLAPLEGEIWVPLNIQCWYGKMRLKNLKIGPFYDDCIYEKTVDRPCSNLTKKGNIWWTILKIYIV